MNVTFVSLEWPNLEHVGGVGRYAYRLAESLRSRVDLSVITFEGGAALPGVQMHYIPRPRGRLSRFYGAPFRVRRAVAQTNPHVIHSFGDDWAISPRKRAPLVRTFHGSALSEARSSSGLRKLNHLILAATEMLSARRATLKIAVGPESAGAFQCDRLMPPVTAVRPLSSVAKTDHPSVVFIGAFAGRKRGFMVEQAVAAASSYLDVPVSLTVFGPVSDAASWSPTTTHRADASDKDVQATIRASWVLMAPSLYEGFGIPTFEALALETLVIASSNPGSNYIRGLMNQDSPLAIVADADLEKSLADRLAMGSAMKDEERATSGAAVESLLRAASADRLVYEVYALLDVPDVQKGGASQ
ncbi:glycosyltransferase family 4 protein [Frigoribacterium sp. 2-23]|uniref:glycosyltransferase family 4 protein n=1 Tax=Frigoribacterium sp. 2-23 TaxID=3415006 RepID=UPI003C6F4C51